MAESETRICDKFILLLQTTKQMIEKNYFRNLQEIFRDILDSLHTTEKCSINDNFMESLDNLMLSVHKQLSDETTQTCDFSSVCQCLTSSVRVCRNLCALNKSNQTCFHDSGSFILALREFLFRHQSTDCLSDDVIVLYRCAVQFLCNYASGNPVNQLQVWTTFQDILLYCLYSTDEKLRNYTQIGVHICLSDALSPVHNVSQSGVCWDILHKCVDLAVKEETVNGLLVIEDALKLPHFCENVFPRLENQSKVKNFVSEKGLSSKLYLGILVLEVLINLLQKIPDGGFDITHAQTDIPSTSNIEFLAADFVIQSHHLPHIGTDSHDDSMALCIVKELEGLCLASVHHGLYPCLQEMQQLIKVSISLLQSVEDLGQEGNPMFENAAKMSDLGNVNRDHPVFGLKRDLIRLIGNLAYKNKSNQDLIREQNGIPLILNKTNIDGKNPFIIQWSVLAIHNLTEDNVENQQYIASLKLEGVANNQAVLDEMGLTAESEGEKVVIKKKRRS